MSVWQGKSILVVDDNAMIRKHLKDLYTSIGLKVVGEAQDGVKAIEFVEANAPDLVSLDIIMPEMDGIECYRYLRSKHEHLAMLIVSCMAGDQSVVDSFSEEIPSYVFSGKPASQEGIRSKLDLLFSEGQNVILQEIESAEEAVEEDLSSSMIPDINQIA